MSLVSESAQTETLDAVTILTQALKLIWEGHPESSLIIQNALDATGSNDDHQDEAAIKFLTTYHEPTEST